MVHYCEAYKYPHWAIYVYQRCQLLSPEELNNCIEVILKRNINDWIHNEDYYEMMKNNLNISKKLLINLKVNLLFKKKKYIIKFECRQNIGTCKVIMKQC